MRKKIQFQSRRLQIASGVLLALTSVGCVSKPGFRPSIWPMEKVDGSPSTSMSDSLSSTSKTVKSQFATVGSAMSSAYSKTKSAITSPFTNASNPTELKDSATGLSKSVSIAPEVLVAQGSYFESQGNYAKALDSYSRALEAEANNPVALMSMARLYENQKDTAKSIEFYKKTASVAPNHADAYAELGAVYARSGDLKAAKDELQKAVNLQPKNRTYRSSLAGILLDSGNPQGALDELKQTESSAMAQYQMAYLHFNRKNIPATQQHLNAALQIDPNLKPARDLLASMGGAQNISQMVQQGQQFGQQAKGVYQQAGNIANSVQNALVTPPASVAGVGPAAQAVPYVAQNPNGYLPAPSVPTASPSAVVPPLPNNPQLLQR